MTLLYEDPFDVRRARSAPGLLRELNDAGVLVAADVHVARRLGALASESGDEVLLAVALAVRAPRLGHVTVDLTTIRDTATVESDEPVDLSALPWPEPGGWLAAVAASPLVAAAGSDPPGPGATPRPLRLEGSSLYLDRYWREEVDVAADLRALDSSPPPGLDGAVLEQGLERLFPGETDGRQCAAAAAAVRRRLAVVAGGPGTGKTTTVARIVALLAEQAAATGAPPPLVALAAPTGKAAARLEEAVHEQAASLAVDEEIRTGLLDLRAATLHRLLGWRPDSHSRFRHHRGRRLPHDVVIIDETSMVSLTLMARLVEAIRPEARLVLVGDPGQLASIEAGAVLGDVVGPAASPESDASTLSGALTPPRVLAGRREPPSVSFGAGIVTLDRVRRYAAGGAIDRLAEAIRRGDGDATVGILAAGEPGVTWLDTGSDALDPVREHVLAAARTIARHAHAGAAREAIDALGAFRLLCAHRRGPEGVAGWTARVEGWLGVGDRPWYPGRPLLVTANDYELGLFNGDTGVVVETAPDRLVAAFARRDEVVELSPSRLGAAETAYAMTIHKSQGSQFHTAAVLLPAPGARILTRELLYTAATRAREHLILAGTQEAVRAAVSRPVARASGLRDRLWG